MRDALQGRFTAEAVTFRFRGITSVVPKAMAGKAERPFFQGAQNRFLPSMAAGRLFDGID
jgi:hypothetical protein